MKTRERKEQTNPVEFLTRDLPQAEVKVDKDLRTLTFPFSSTRAVERFVWYDDNLPEGASSQFSEVISHDPAHWRLERVTEGVCPYLKDHSSRDKLGRVMSVTFSGDKAIATVKLRRSSEADQELLDVEDGTGGAGVSFGYRVYRYRVLEPAAYDGEGWDRKLTKMAVLEAIDLEIYEVSSCTIPADPSVGFGKSAIDLRTIQIEGDPHWERATPGELKKGDFVGWNSSGGTSKGRIETVATSGSVQAVPTGPSMDGTTDQPAYLVSVWQEEADGWKASDVKVVKRASSLTEIASLKKSAIGSQQHKSKEKPVGKRSTKTKPETQTRELTLADYLTVSSPALSDVVTGLEDTLAAIDAAASSDSTIDTTMLYQNAIDDMTDQLYTLYAVPDPDATEDATETDTPMATGVKTMEPAQSTPQETDRDLQFKAMQEELQTMKRRDLVTRKFTTLRQKAEALRSAGKLTPAEFNDKFSDIDGAIDLYTKAADSRIDGLEERLNDIDKYTPAVEFGSRLKNEPLEVPETRSEYDAELEAYRMSKGKS